MPNLIPTGGREGNAGWYSHPNTKTGHKHANKAAFYFPAQKITGIEAGK